VNEMSEKRKKQIEWNTRTNWGTLKRDSDFLNKQIGKLVEELDLNRENWKGSKGLVLVELQLKHTICLFKKSLSLLSVPQLVRVFHSICFLRFSLISFTSFLLF
jgi:hypothetical protein